MNSLKIYLPCSLIWRYIYLADLFGDIFTLQSYLEIYSPCSLIWRYIYLADLFGDIFTLQTYLEIYLPCSLIWRYIYLAVLFGDWFNSFLKSSGLNTPYRSRDLAALAPPPTGAALGPAAALDALERSTFVWSMLKCE